MNDWDSCGVLFWYFPCGRGCYPSFYRGREDGNSDGGVAGEVLPLWHSLMEVIKAPELADRATSQGMSKADTLTDRRTDRKKVSQWKNTSCFLSFFQITFPEHMETFHILENYSSACVCGGVICYR